MSYEVHDSQKMDYLVACGVDPDSPSTVVVPDDWRPGFVSGTDILAAKRARVRAESLADARAELGW